MQSPDVLDTATMQEIENRLKERIIPGREARKKHAGSIKSGIMESERKAERGICPRCGGKLIERNGRNGKFTGCSNFPKCRYTANWQ